MAKVLLVEDDNNLRDIYQARLAAEGYDISTAQDGEEALVVAKQTKPDLVVSDVMMPKISGFEMLDILRNTPGLEHVKVIMLTALGQSEDRDRADSLGADKYLVKSQVTLEDIVKTAHELLGEEDAAAAAAPAPPAATPEATPVETAPEPEPMAVEPAPVAPEPAPAEPAIASEPATPASDSTTPTADDSATEALAQAAASLGATLQDDTTAMPAPEPVEPVQTTVDDSSATDAPASDDAQVGSTAQEQAVVTDQINSFEQTEATPEASAETSASPETPAETVPAPSAPEVADAPVEPVPAPTTDDQLMADAASELADSASDESGAEVVAPTPAAEPEVADEEDNEALKEEAAKTNISISGKKVIQPLDSQPKPDINELLAREEAASGNVATGTTVVADSEAPIDDTPTAPTIAHQPGESFAPQTAPEPLAPPATDEDRPSGAPPTAPGEDKKDGQAFDPNSVAL